MKKILFIAAIASLILSSCGTKDVTLRKDIYKGIYDEKPIAVLVMPPINRSTNVEAKGYFHSTLCVPMANAGYYVIPPLLSIEMLKKESAYDAELFLNEPLNKFGDFFGADVAMFTIIHKWDKSVVGSKIYVDIEYILKSTKTNEVLFSRLGHITYDASIQVQGFGLAGALVSLAASMVNTALTEYIGTARSCNAYALGVVPLGKYSPEYGLDGDLLAGPKEFSVTLK